MIYLSKLIPSRSTLYGFSAVITLFVAVVTTLLVEVDSWSKAGLEQISNNFLQARSISAMRDAIQRRELIILRMINTSETFSRDAESLRYHQLAGEYEAAREKLLNTELDKTLADYLVQLDAVADYARPYYNSFVEVMVFNETSKQDLEAIANEGRVIADKLLFLLDKIITHQATMYDQMVADYHRLRDRILIGVLMAFTAIAIIVIVVVRVSNQQFKRVSRLSIMDEVSGIYNRRYFEMVFDEEWKRSMREQAVISLIMIDIDYFKAYNDAYGHQEGDVCLREVAKILSSCIKRSSDFTARYGGEEFAVVLPNTNAHRAGEIAEKLRMAVEDAHIKAGVTRVSSWVTISVGVSTTIAKREQSSSVLIDAADSCLYESKERGRNRVFASLVE